MRRLNILTAIALLCLSVPCLGAEPAEITKQLCRSGGGSWTRALPLVVENKTSDDYSESPITVPIAGSADAPVEGALPIANELAQSIRVADTDGVEYVFNITDSTGKFIDRGAIGEGRSLTLPVTVPAGSKRTYYVFAGNALAYPNPDRLDRFSRLPDNLSFETGDYSIPNNWTFDLSGSDGLLTWTDETPADGAKCVRCDVPAGSAKKWIAARQTGIAVKSGAKYRFEAKVRGKNLDAEAVGWYVHIGNAQKEMISSPMLLVPKASDFDWTTVSIEFTVPENANLLSYGTVLYGSGTAWFDAASLSLLDENGNASPVASIALSDNVKIEKEIAISVLPNVYPCPNSNGKGSSAFDPNALTNIQGKRYVLVCLDDAPNADGERLINLELGPLATRWSRSLNSDDVETLDLNGQPVAHDSYADSIFFSANVVAGAKNHFVIVEKTKPRREKNSEAKKSGGHVANQAFPGTMMQTTNAERANDNDGFNVRSLYLPKFIADRNILCDGDFENVDPKTLKEKENPDGLGWVRDQDEPGVVYSIVSPGVSELGARALRIEVKEPAPRRWRGWRRTLKVEPNRSYLFGLAMCVDSDGGPYDMHMHWHKADGSLSNAGMTSLGKSLSGKTNWKSNCRILRSASDSDTVEIHLTSDTYGAVEYDSVFVVPVDSASPVAFYGGKSGAFQVPAVAKVFEDSTFSAEEFDLLQSDGQPGSCAMCALAREEEETLQIALRFDEDGRYKIDASAPCAESYPDCKLDAPEVFAVGNVLVDYPSSYYNERTPAKTRKFPKASPGCDGWIGMWPDPLVPISTASCPKTHEPGSALDNVDPANWNDSMVLAKDGADGYLALSKGKTRAIWLRFRTSADTKADYYKGVVTLTAEDGKKLEIPYEVNVLNFTAPKTRITGTYDARVATDFFGKGDRAGKLLKISEKLLDRKLSPDALVSSPVFSYDKASGRVDVDWIEYDKEASRFFDELGGKAVYMPYDFYLFGWGVPPKEVEGEKPYPGEWPYDGADRAKLRPEYKRAYQAKLRVYWNHMKEKGWAKNLVLYISDEPFYSKPEIIAQMKALCDMIHEVDPEIPIYSSTWVFVPEWLGYIDVWGVGHYGGVGESALKKIRDANGRIWWTTDGQMCLDTPFCAVERLLPYTCVARDAEKYEFWGATWYTCNPFYSASHLYISQSDAPGVQYYVRYPNGDGYVFYPGDLIGMPGEILDSIRSEQAREGVEDAGWLVGLRRAIQECTSPNTIARDSAEEVLNRALNYLPLNCGCGRYSTRYISDPKEFEQIRLEVGLMYESLVAPR